MIRIIDGRGKDTQWIKKSLNRPSQLEAKEEKEVVKSILREVEKSGDKALLEYTLRFDNADLGNPENMVVSDEEILDAYEKTDTGYIGILNKAKEKIMKFHEKQKQNSWMTFEEEGIILGQKVTPMECVGVYVPGGRAAYPS